MLRGFIHFAGFNSTLLVKLPKHYVIFHRSIMAVKLIKEPRMYAVGVKGFMCVIIWLALRVNLFMP